MVYAQPSICPGEWDIETPMGFWHTNRTPNLDQTTRPYNNQQKKKRTCKIVDFAVPADHRIKLKESEKKNKCLNIARELKKLWNMFVCLGFIDRTRSDTTTPGLSGHGSDSNEGVFSISQSSSITGTSPSDYLVSYLIPSFEGYWLSTEIQSEYSTAPTERAMWNM